MKEGQQYYHCKFFFARFWKENGSFLSKNLRLLLTFLSAVVEGDYCIRPLYGIWKKSKVFSSFCLKKNHSLSKNVQKKIYTDSIAVPLPYPMPFFH